MTRRRIATLLLVLAAPAAGACDGRRSSAGAPAGGPSAPTAGVEAPACADVRYGGRGRAQLVIASTLPLQGVLGSEALQMTRAIEMALARRGWRAGRYSVGYQSCDDSTVQAGGSTPERCEANGRAFARTRSVIGVIGPMYSSCAASLLPVVNRATDGALAVISPATTYVGLTHEGAGVARGDPRRYYPSGRRNYVRVASADDVQGAANAVLAGRLGLRRVYALHDGSLYGMGLAAVFRRAAEASGVRVVAVRAWDPKASGYAGLARAIRRASAGGVFLGGQQVNNGARLVADLRAGVGPQVRLLAPEGMGPPAALVQRAGRAAEGVTLTMPDIPRAFLSRAGRRFAAAVHERTGKDPCCYTMHAAQAADLALDAIAQSDGTRRSVTDRLFRAQVRGGLLGSFSFDRNGDINLRRIFVHQIRHGKLSFFTAITPSARLVSG
ncbi:MAG: branched-chain amino acid transport system substrate-binding protein [bacterium]